jgi:hypothetical protein
MMSKYISLLGGAFVESLSSVLLKTRADAGQFWIDS